MKQQFPFLLTLLLVAAFCQAQTTLPDVQLEDFAGGLDQPLGIENCGDDRLFIIERPGKIVILDEEGEEMADPFLDITAQVTSAGGEQGLLGLAFDPDYKTNGFFYVHYTDKNEDHQISRFNVSVADSNKADETSEIFILGVHDPYENHNGGQLRFGPDGYLYIAFGDGGDAGDPHDAAQNLRKLLGKMLRIDVSELPYTIPATNPFIDRPLVQKEIWASGLRNPWRFSFDRLTGDLWIGDVGQSKWEEINFQPASSTGGENYGWSCYEGHHLFDPDDCHPADFTAPVYNYFHDDDFLCGGTVIGGFVYRGAEFPKMYGKYIFTDYCTGAIRITFMDSGVWKTELLGYEEALEYVSFGENAGGELFLADISGGEIYKVVDSSELRVGNLERGLQAQVYPNPNSGQFTVQWFASNNENCKVEIINTLGTIVSAENRNAQEGLNTWNLSIEGPTYGHYMVVIRSSNEFRIGKFMVE